MASNELQGPPSYARNGDQVYPYRAATEPAPASSGGDAMAAGTVGAAAATGSPIAAAGITAAAMLFTQLMQQRAAREQEERARKYQLAAEARARLDAAQNQNVEVAQRMGQNEQGALGQLLGVLARTQR